ncbi:MAG: ATP-binding protein [Lachnospiraceae bacterium]|nr:ATP-binding protein [Lachnospiraceae bacterium]
MEKIFPATDEALQDVNLFVEGNLEEAGCSMKNMMKIMVALEELFVNVAHYAYEDGDGKVSVSFDLDGDNMILTLKDSGKPFDPLAKADPDISLSAEERQIGGLGIYMVKKSMDDVQYEYKDGCNIVTITHNIR